MGFSGVPPVGASGVPNSDLSFTASSLAVVMSVRMALDIAEETKASTENRMIRRARMQVHVRKLLTVGPVELSHDSLRLSAVTGLNSAASLVNAEPFRDATICRMTIRSDRRM